MPAVPHNESRQFVGRRTAINGKSPTEQRPHWRDNGAAFRDDEAAAAGRPSIDNPLVYEMFGHLSDKKSIVLTEDDYFEHIIGMTRIQNRPQPSVMQEKLTDSGLMFLGFGINDWDFRVFIHLLQSLQGSKLRGFYKNVAVQLDPENGLGTDITPIRRYLEKYFAAPAMQIEVGIFGGAANPGYRQGREAGEWQAL